MTLYVPATDQRLAETNAILVAMNSHLARIASGDTIPEKDAQTGRYANIAAWLASQRDGLIYGVKIPKYDSSDSTTCIKTGANAGLTVTPSTFDTAGQDDYQSKLAFKGWDACGGADADGSPFATHLAIYDPDFSYTGRTGNVWRLCPVLYWRYVEKSGHFLLEICDTPKGGFSVQPGGKLPDGTIRPFMLYAKYAAGTYDGKIASVSGVQLRNRNISHNTLMDIQTSVGAGYSGKSIADDWYVKVMFLLKYAKKSTQDVFTGCSGYTAQVPLTASETGVKRVVVSNTDAAKFDIGSSVMLGSATYAPDRGNATAYDVFDAATILRTEAYDSSNTAIYVDTASTFNTTAGAYLSTAPWRCGCLDGVQGVDGTITASGRTNSHEPFLLQGIECLLGAYEILSAVILNATSAPAVEVYIAYDSADDATSLTADFVKTGELAAQADAGWLYQKDIADAGGLLIGVGIQSSSGKGTGDATYQNAATSQGLREFLGLGNLNDWGLDGFFCVHSVYGLGGTGWIIGSRLSATGRAAA